MRFIKQIYWALSHFFFWQFTVKRQWKKVSQGSVDKSTGVSQPFSIGIVTYISRYEKFFKPLIEKLALLMPDVEIIVILNGYYDQEKQKEYIRTCTEFLGNFPNVKYSAHTSPEGLSKLWNEVIINSSNDSVFILNDDIDIAPGFRTQLLGMKKETITLINNSWSHFLINKKIIGEFGWFDERFTGIGNEDLDYDFRLTAKKLQIEDVLFNSIRNYVEVPKDFSYGKDLPTVNKKYSVGNLDFFEKKWETSTNEKPGFLFSKKFGKWFNPVPKLPTPDLYPDIKL